jgi:hypothetical protein
MRCKTPANGSEASEVVIDLDMIKGTLKEPAPDGKNVVFAAQVSASSGG